jgi:hypothetical protein
MDRLCQEGSANRSALKRARASRSGDRVEERMSMYNHSQQRDKFGIALGMGESGQRVVGVGGGRRRGGTRARLEWNERFSVLAPFVAYIIACIV